MYPLTDKNGNLKSFIPEGSLGLKHIKLNRKNIRENCQSRYEDFMEVDSGAEKKLLNIESSDKESVLENYQK